ncbi:hypothetical protein [Maribacter sp. ACAM166]|uniref:hypothetical protein n=1 Tax=Maribacter sp. ACAM166 TaxID=2508996 RepID=UPI0010FE28DC|nr:hypothetical protein [Maribacter sp. ACAM166]TLP81365.1 hypothetical protein ES765_04985 [Maribacter sp. ACAM166]
MHIKFLLLRLFFTRKAATRNKIMLRIGAHFIKRGAGVTVGQAIPFKAMKHTKARTMFIDNLYYNFKTNTVTHTMSKNPVEGFTPKRKKTFSI